MHKNCLLIQTFQYSIQRLKKIAGLWFWLKYWSVVSHKDCCHNWSMIVISALNSCEKFEVFMLRSCHMTNHMLLFTENKTAVLWATFDSQNIHFHVNFEFLRISYLKMNLWKYAEYSGWRTWTWTFISSLVLTSIFAGNNQKNTLGED